MTGIGDFVDDYLEKSIQAWYGANETYGTQSDWLTGEGLTEAWGHDPNQGVYPQYSNAISELVGENPVFNALIDSERILSHDSGGMRGPGWLDWAELGISAVPVAGPAIARGAGIINKHVTKPIWQNIQDASKSKFDPALDWRLDTPDELTSLGDDIIKQDETLDMVSDASSDLETALLAKGFDVKKTLDELVERPSIYQISAKEWDTIEPRIKAEWLEREGLVEGDMIVFHYLNEGRDDLLKFLNIKRSPNIDDIPEFKRKVSRDLKLFDRWMMNWPDTPFMQVLREGDGPTERAIKNFRSIKEADKLNKEFSLAERMAMKPSHVDTSDWEKLVEGLDDMGEVRNIARRMTLRLID